MQNLIAFVKKNFFILSLLAISLLFFAVALRINIFRYNNFDYGKFDLGNMTQMVWNASQGRGLYLTDYFGTNLPRWAMSHVDPILFIFVPLFWFFPHPMTLVIAQLILVIFSSILVFKISKLHLKSNFLAFLLGFVYLFNPSIGFLTAWTGFHGVTAVIPFFLGAFYWFELIHQKQDFSRKNLGIFWTLLVLTMMGKEQIPLYIFLYGLFILLFRNEAYTNLKSFLTTKISKLAISMFVVSVLWFVTAFFIIIPANAHHRINGFNEFAESIGIQGAASRDVALPNYFLNRYDEFGTSYTEIAANMVLNPRKSVEVFFGGDKLENFRRTVEPFAYLPLAFPAIFMLAVPDLMINFMTTAGGIGTSEIMNHRISMIVPVMMLATIFAIKYLSTKIRVRGNSRISAIILGLIVTGFTIYTTHYYNNPVYLWLNQAVQKRIIPKVFAKTDDQVIKENLEVGEVVRLSELEDKDRECAVRIVNMIPDEASVSGPDSLGAHLAIRDTYAIFPALHTQADYVIVDVFARKILTILDIDIELIRNVVEDIIKDENYELKMGCGNYFVFENVGAHDKPAKLPIQERFNYEGSVNYEFFQAVNIVDYEIPESFVKGESSKISITYFRTQDGSKKDTSLEEYIMFTSLVNQETGEIYQMANLPSYSIKLPEQWKKNRYYLEDIEVVVPGFVEDGDYMVFVGMGNKNRTRSMYLGNTMIK